VSGEAAAFAAKGNRVFPFHLGDMNLPTPSVVVDAAMKAIRDGKTGYCPPAGIPLLRETLAADISVSHGMNYGPENIAIQPGGKPVIGKFFQALMNPGDEVLYPNPGYPIYESQIEYLGGTALPYGYIETDGRFALDFDSMERQITPKTKFIVLNDLQNPITAECTPEEHARLAALVLKHDLRVLVDEAYFEMRYSGRSVSFAKQPGMRERCVLLYTFSKKFAMTGWRLGAAVGPREIIDVIAKLNVNAESCSCHFIQHGAVAGLTGDQSEVKALLETLRERRNVAADALNGIDGITCGLPNATFYLFPNVTGAMARMGYTDYEIFRRAALEATGVSFCSRIHFGRMLPGETQRYIRFAYSGIDLPEIQEGLARLKSWVEG
jgi:aspartate/methionine/tyrosine aminotransferase